MSLKHIITSIFFGMVGAFFFSFVRLGLFPKVFAKTDEVVSASVFNIVDSQGRVRGQIGLSKEGSPGIWFMDAKGVARVSAGVYPDDSGYIGLQDKNGQMIQLMRSFGVKEAPLLIFKNAGADMMITGLNPGSEILPFLMTYEKDRSKKIHFGKYDGP